MTSGEVIHELNAAFNRGDAESWIALFSDDVEWTDQQGGVGAEGGVGLPGLVAHSNKWTEAIESLSADLDLLSEDGDYALCRTRWHGTAREGGVPVEAVTFDTYEVRDGVIRWAEFSHRDEFAGRAAIERRRAARS